MDSYSLLNVAARIKDESVDELFTVNDGHEVTEKTSTIQNFQTFAIKQENSTHRLKKCDRTRENEHEDLWIEFECREHKPKLNSGLKIEDSCENYLQVSELIRDWAPLVWLAPGERFLPLGVPEFLDNMQADDDYLKTRLSLLLAGYWNDNSKSVLAASIMPVLTQYQVPVSKKYFFSILAQHWYPVLAQDCEEFVSET
ncbi:hypothetical protein TKK_0007139 [Trichogramma kaykai]